MVYLNRPYRNKRSSGGIGLAALSAIVVLTAASASPAYAASTARVRSSATELQALLREGADRSATFSALVDSVERSNGIVYVEFGYCAFGHLNACVLPLIASPHGDRYLRILVTPDKNRRSHDQLLALIAHELRHALEVFDAPEVVDVDTMNALYRRDRNAGNWRLKRIRNVSRARGRRPNARGTTGRANATRQGEMDPVGRARALFSASELETMPRIVLAAVKPERVSSETEGYVVPGYPVIYVAAWSDTYKAAQTGDRAAITKLASIIAHERTHVERGADERQASDAENPCCGAATLLPLSLTVLVAR